MREDFSQAGQVKSNVLVLGLISQEDDLVSAALTLPKILHAQSHL